MIQLSSSVKTVQAEIPLASSKSESNRALIIQALSGNPIELNNLSSARDTQTMIRLLGTEGHVMDVIDAGTTMRFLTAYCSAVGRDQILTGTPRMCKRPIGILVDALRKLGAEIEYWKQDGFPPLHIISKGGRLKGTKLDIQGNVSSQFITALLMIGPALEGGLRLGLVGDIYSRPYINMTLGLMNRFGVEAKWETESTIWVPEQPYQSGEYTIESDWSAASYWYSLVALSESAKIKLLGLRKESLQGDSHMAEIMKGFGVSSTFEEDGVVVEKETTPEKGKEVYINFSQVPDLAQTLAVIAAVQGVKLHMTGLESLRIKETDRIFALQEELAKFGCTMLETAPGQFTIGGDFKAANVEIETYEDHRMAMAFGPVAQTGSELTFKDDEVVNKSYPEYWDHLALAGMDVKRSE
ncbi:MAG: 3-phosphoshikimate 1-carboxyvinyltransferase [Bacteroidota bacterium]